MDIARKAYPDVPLFRYPYTDLSEGQIAGAMTAAGGPKGKPAFDTAGLAGKSIRFTGEGAPALLWAFAANSSVSLNGGRSAPYGALNLGPITLVTHLVPDSTQAWALIWNRSTNAATVFELWFGGGPAPRAREIDRAVWHGTIDGLAADGAELHHATLRSEGRAIAWTEDTGLRTIEYYCSVSYTHWIELDRLEEHRGYSAPADYIQLTEELYAFARVEAEFSGLLHLYVYDANTLQSAGFRLGFNGIDELEYYMFRGTGEWLGQNARFEKLGDFSAEPLKIERGKKGERRIYRPLATMDKMTSAEVDASIAAGNVHVFDRPSPMAGNGTEKSAGLSGKAFTIAYDSGPTVEYRMKGAETLDWRMDGKGSWTEARYNAWEMMPGTFIFGHLLAGTKNHDGHIVVVDLDAGLATCFHGYLHTPYIANEAGCETLFGKITGAGIPDPGTRRHERTRDLLGRAFTWEYSPGLNSMHLYSTPNTTSWIIPTPDGHFATEWSGSGDFVKIRDQLYFARWQEEACNGTLGTIFINMRTMHDAGIGYHMGKQGGLSLSAVGAPARHAGKIEVSRFFGPNAWERKA
ncbi:hypothetical protein GRI89_11235 [Altererythrobacter salegens]|uniref:Molybdenum cofactor biosynthesis protein F n=1 Tax=Croceibacterium salegens TaxID=1737568 RepID=A0A6I4SVW0_9SPHN|nr:MoaF N-terminal domain-containing protein [Croceibacterium salegens]MXO60111.1 hypothetical protein [Croceibacterium salegens]